MMPDTLTLEQAQQLAQDNPSNFNPFGANSFEGLVEDAKKRMADAENSNATDNAIKADYKEVKE